MASRRVYLETFGCQMNELDSELVSGQLRALGYSFTRERDEADVILYNTCSVREHAEQKVWSRLGEDKARKLARPAMVVGVLGCMAERDGTDLIRRMPVVDVMCGPGELDKLPALLDNAVRTRESLLADAQRNAEEPEQPEQTRDEPGVDSGNGSSPVASGFSGSSEFFLKRSARQVALQGNASRRSSTLAAAADTLEMLDLSRSVSPDDHTGSAYVRITRGCNKFCTYCVVPFTRGAEVHRPPRHIVDECKRLADSGVVEVTLLGQTVNHYRFEHGAAVTVGGVAQPQKGRSYTGGHRRDPFSGDKTTTFADLLAMIHEEVPQIQRLRFVTSYPRDFGDDVLAVIREHPRICRYLHVPAQSGSNAVLARMNRGYTVEEYLEFLDRARAALHQPEIGRPLTVAGDIIVGFPGETEPDHEATKALLERARYKNSFIFKYSPRPGTVAFDKLADDVPDEVKRRRNNELLALQLRISETVSAEFVGQTLDVFVQGVSRREEKKAIKASRYQGIALTVNGRAAAPDVEAPVVDAAGVQMSARTEGDVIVFFDAPGGSSPDDLIGRIVRVRIDSSTPLALHGRFEP